MSKGRIKVRKSIAAVAAGVTYQTIDYWAEKYGWKKFDEKYIRYYADDVADAATMKYRKKPVESVFSCITLKRGESIRLLDSINSPKNFENPRKYLTSCQYGISNFGNVYTLNHGHCLSKFNDTNGYEEVRLQFGSKSNQFIVHRLVALLWCDNGKFKKDVHHIDNNRTNNRPDNLIWLTPGEHGKAHRLMRKGEESGDSSEYYAFIEEMQKDNKVDEEMRMFIIQDATGFHHYIYVCESLWNDVISGKRALGSIESTEIIADLLDDYEVDKCREMYEKIIDLREKGEC